MNNWLETFPEKVHKITESNCLQLTAEAWNIEEDVTTTNEALIIKDKFFYTLIWRCTGTVDTS